MIAGPGRPTACVSVDLDSVASHLRGYGLPAPEDGGEAYGPALDRALALLAERAIRATFFLTAQEAVRHPEAVRSIAAAGHEIASHGLSHPPGFGALPPARLDEELVRSRALLETVSGERVEGFRAPSWDLPRDLPLRLARAGYRYDASRYPSPALALLGIAVWLRGGRRGPPPALRRALRPGPRGPRRIDTPAGTIVDIPLATTPLLRIPVYHTLSHGLPARAFRALLAWAARSRVPVSYVFHAVDFLALEDGVDPRLAVHPGMRQPLEAKLASARRVLDWLAARAECLPLRELAARVAGAGAGS